MSLSIKIKVGGLAVGIGSIFSPLPLPSKRPCGSLYTDFRNVYRDIDHGFQKTKETLEREEKKFGQQLELEGIDPSIETVSQFVEMLQTHLS